MTPGRRRRAIAVASSATLVLCACTSGSGGAAPDDTIVDAQRCLDVDPAPEPVVDQLGDAIAAIELAYGSPQEFFEISADLQRVSLIVATDDATAAEQSFYCGGAFAPPEAVGAASGATFASDAVDVDTGAVFDRLRDELDDPTIIDFAVQGTGDGGVVYDASVASAQGGVLLVRLGRDGSILGVQAQ